MGKGDKKTTKGKRAQGSYGKTRKRKDAVIAAPKLKAKKVAEKVEKPVKEAKPKKEAAEKKVVEKKPAVKKVAAEKKPAAPKKAPAKKEDK